MREIKMHENVNVINEITLKLSKFGITVNPFIICLKSVWEGNMYYLRV